MSMFRPCAVIPTRNHVDALSDILAKLEQELPAVIVVDDGSRTEIGKKIASICARHECVEYRRHDINRGKGTAILDGLVRAAARGFTHAVQIDADGQHDLASLEALLAKARRYPNAIVTGEPIFDESMPSSRRFWRPFTNFWVRVNTLHPKMPDALCGFRVYPVASSLEMLTRSVNGRRMEFDSEILVKAHWRGIPITSVPVRVSYPAGNFSNFDIVRDNMRLTLMQTRLFFGMLLRLPVLLSRSRSGPDDVTAPTHWPEVRERGAYWGLRFVAGVYRVLGRIPCLIIMVPVIFYFFATGGEQRRASKDYLARLWQNGHFARPPTLWISFRHFMAFGIALLDRLAAWTGRISDNQIAGIQSGLLYEVEMSGHGAFVITAHIGSPEVIRAIAMLGRHIRINVLAHVEHAKLFNRLISHFAPHSPVRAIPVTSVGIDTAILLSEAISRGEWVVMAGDRVPVTEDGRTVDVPFLGALASLPQGPYILGALLKAPSYVLFCVRGRKGFKVHFSKFADKIVLPRGDRIKAIRGYAATFAREMEAQVAETPLQWFNFYSFWKTAQSPVTSDDLSRAAE